MRGVTAIVLAGLVAAGAVLATLVVVRPWGAAPSVEQGARLLAQGDDEAAIRLLLPAVAAAPSDAWGHYYLGLAYARVGAGRGALTQLAEAVRLAPGEAGFQDGLGRAYRDAGDASRARAAFEEAIRRDPAEPRYRVDLAGLLLDEGRVPEAMAALRRAVELAPRSASLRLVMARMLGRAGDRDEMLRQYRAAARLAPTLDQDTALAELAREELRAAERPGADDALGREEDPEPGAQVAPPALGLDPSAVRLHDGARDG